MRETKAALTLFAIAALAACNTQPDGGGAETGDPEATGAPAAAPDPDAPISIIRSDVEHPELPEAPLEPLAVTIGFPDGGSDLDTAATLALEELAASAQMAEDSAVILRAHSDAGGSDAVNMRVSEARGEAVRDWLVDNGVSAERITLIAFGEQNPVEPNALPDGEPNEAGRAANRRVDIEVIVGDARPAAAETSRPEA